MVQAHAELIGLESALSLSAPDIQALHERFGNEGLAKLLALLGLNRELVRAEGASVWDRDGNRYLDFVAGYGSLNLGHNPPRVLEAVRRASDLPNIFHTALSPLAGALAQNLATVAPGDLQRSFFCNSGAEAVEGALKLARAATGRAGLLHTENSFHGKTFGALSVTGREKYREPFAPLVPDTRAVPFGDVDALEDALRDGGFAAFIVEPIQGEGGIVVPPDGYLPAARSLCSEYGTLLIVDEVQTGFGRTGSFFACEHEGVEPDVLCLAKSLGGGVVPIGAFVTTDQLWQKAFGGPQKCLLHSSTFGGNALACAAGLATVEVLLEDDLAGQAREKGAYLMAKLEELRTSVDVIREVRGRGLLIGVEFAQPTGGLLARLSGGAVNALSREYLASMVAGELFNRHRIVAAYTLNNPNVIRLEPPLTIEQADLDVLVEAMGEVLGRLGSLGGVAWSGARTAVSAVFSRRKRR